MEVYKPLDGPAVALGQSFCWEICLNYVSDPLPSLATSSFLQVPYFFSSSSAAVRMLSTLPCLLLR